MSRSPCPEEGREGMGVLGSGYPARRRERNWGRGYGDLFGEGRGEGSGMVNPSRPYLLSPFPLPSTSTG